MGTLLVPISIALIGLALQNPERKHFLAVASVFLFSFWVYVSSLYRASAVTARSVLMDIEKKWDIDKEMCLYNQHGQIGLKRFNLFYVQVIFLIILIVLWIVLVIVLPESKNLSQPIARLYAFYQSSFLLS